MSWYVITNLYMMEIKFFKNFLQEYFCSHFLSFNFRFPHFTWGRTEIPQVQLPNICSTNKAQKGLIHKSNKILFCYYSLIIKKCGISQSRRLGKMKVITNWDNLFMSIIWMQSHFHKFIRKFQSNHNILAYWVKFHYNHV